MRLVPAPGTDQWSLAIGGRTGLSAGLRGGGAAGRAGQKQETNTRTKRANAPVTRRFHFFSPAAPLPR